MLNVEVRTKRARNELDIIDDFSNSSSCRLKTAKNSFVRIKVISQLGEQEMLQHTLLMIWTRQVDSVKLSKNKLLTQYTRKTTIRDVFANSMVKATRIVQRSQNQCQKRRKKRKMKKRRRKRRRKAKKRKRKTKKRRKKMKNRRKKMKNRRKRRRGKRKTRERKMMKKRKIRRKKKKMKKKRTKMSKRRKTKRTERKKTRKRKNLTKMKGKERYAIGRLNV